MPDQGLGPPIWTQAIRRRPPSQNDFTRKWKSERLGYRAVSRSWANELDPPNHMLRAKGPRTVQFTRIIGKGERAFDDGNFVGGLKPVLDHLVRLDWLVDDSPRLCLDLYRQHKSQVLEFFSYGGTRLAGPALVIELWNGIWKWGEHGT